MIIVILNKVNDTLIICKDLCKCIYVVFEFS